MLYLCFLEIVRQVSTKCKEQALFLLKIWHTYFDNFSNKIQTQFEKINDSTYKLEHSMKALTDRVEQLFTAEKSKDREFLEIKTKYEKSLTILDMCARHLYRQEDKAADWKEKFDVLNENMGVLLPNYKDYFKAARLHNELMHLDVAIKSDVQGELLEGYLPYKFRKQLKT